MNEEQFKFNFDPNIGSDITCEECGGNYFRQVVAMKLLPGVAVGQLKDVVYPMSPEFRCDQCGTPLDFNNIKTKENGENENGQSNETPKGRIII